MKKFVIVLGVFVLGGVMVSAQGMGEVEGSEKVVSEGVSLESFLEEEFPTEEVTPVKIEEVEVEEKIVLDPVDRGIVPKVELYGTNEEEDSAEEAILFRFSDEGASLKDDDVPTTLAPPECEKGDGFFSAISIFFQDLFGKCRK